ncbi:MAG: hypothetical protein ACTSVY_13920 [Candidatus Helarchaeota archaeon]
MAKFKLLNVKEFLTIIDTVSTLIKEANLIFTPDSFGIKAFDPTKAAMLKFEMKKSAFEVFESDKEQEVWLELDEFNKYLKRCESNESITFEFKEDVNKVKLTFQGTKSKRKRSFTLSTIEEPEEYETREDGKKIKKQDMVDKIINNYSNMNLTVNARLSAKIFLTAIKDAKTVESNTLEIKTSAKKIQFIATREIVNDEYNYEIDLDDEETKDLVEKIEVKDETSVKLSLIFMERIFKSSSISSAFNFYCGKDEAGSSIPAKFDFSTDDITLYYILAPQMEEEEDFDEDFDDTFNDDDDFEDI